MTIRRQWLLVLTVTAVLAICVNSFILSSLINKYFMSYSTDSYNNHISQIEQLAVSALQDGSISEQRLSVQLESHLDDPIISIKLYDASGKLVASADNTPGGGYGMMNGMMHRNNSEEVDTYQLTDGGNNLGVLNITRYSSLGNSQVSVLFRVALLRNSAISFVVVLFVLIIIGIFISRTLSRDLSNTAAQALRIDMGGSMDYKPSKVREIRIIQSGLETLQNRLKIKQIVRKRVVDELVHQTRTPLTIMKTHLEGIEDGVIKMTDDEIKVCQAQLDNISSIITNMSKLIDADKPSEIVSSEELDLHSLISQIISGLKVQFEKKKISLQLLSSQKVRVKTDKYKLSQSVYNLLTNAYKFTAPGGRVEVSYQASDSKVAIIIKDTGTGIAEEDLPHLFDAYFRGRNTASITGDGLGLYVVKENLEQMGGSVIVSSKPGVGSEFTITVPVQ
ncbi:HAMP domain-containing histidine kinase [Oscillospiraceae bacterium CM]|nr:HAMP domain-containing histidine kinase [Oscillospiraceae bacterium CM]